VNTSYGLNLIEIYLMHLKMSILVPFMYHLIIQNYFLFCNEVDHFTSNNQYVVLLGHFNARIGLLPDTNAADSFIYTLTQKFCNTIGSMLISDK